MQIQINTGNSIANNDRQLQHTEEVVRTSLDRFSAQITRIEVHLSDENSDKKFGTMDKRCVIEARLAGIHPISVTLQAATLEQAVAGAVEKLKRSIDSTLGRRGQR